MTRHAKRIVPATAAFVLLLLAGLGSQSAGADPVTTEPAPRVRGDGRLEGRARALALAKARSVEIDLVGVVERAAASSVTILTRHAFDRRRGFVAGAGSGILINFRGLHVLTNNHVVSHQGQLEIVTSTGRHFAVRVRARDKSNDLALLTIVTPDASLEPVDLERRTSTRLREGAWVVATGNPFLLAADGGSVATLGVFSGTRVGPSSSRYLLQHDAEINPGNSGGPLWSLDGRLLGVNGAIVTRSMQQGGGASYTGASISIPVARVLEFLDGVLPSPAARVAPPTPPPTALRRQPVSLTRRGVTAGRRLGLGVVTSVGAEDRPDGVLVSTIAGRGLVSASRATPKPQPGDVITRVTIEGRSHVIRSVKDLDRTLGHRVSGTAFALSYRRGSAEQVWSGVLR